MNLDEKLSRLETVYSGKYMDVKKHYLELPDGREAVREIVHVRDAVAVLPILPNGEVILVRQHRPAIQRTLLEVPAGNVDSGEKLEETAIRECEEETGYRPQKLIRLIGYAHAEGYSTGWITLFAGMDLEKTGRMNLDSTENLQPIRIPFVELLEMVNKNEIVDSKTILCTLLGSSFLKKTG